MECVHPRVEEESARDPQRELCGQAQVLSVANTEQHPDRVQSELHRCQIEIADQCVILAECGRAGASSRQWLFNRARGKAVAVGCAWGTHPFSLADSPDDNPAFQLGGHCSDHSGPDHFRMPRPCWATITDLGPSDLAVDLFNRARLGPAPGRRS